MGPYWSITTLAGDVTQAWTKKAFDSSIDWHAKTESYNSWCVRGGHGYDAH
jgi:hypothetical protein